MEYYENRISEILQLNNIKLTDDLMAKLNLYYEYLIEYNSNVNLTAITDKNEVFLKHFADSMLGLRYINDGDSVCDIGTGAGFPGLILKICKPNIKLCLVDSLQKRIVFLQNISAKLGFDDIQIIHARAEDAIFKAKHLNSFDCVVARAVAQMSTLTEYCLPFVKVGGSFVAYKSIDSTIETQTAQKAISVCGGVIDKIDTLRLCDDINRNFIVVKKVKPCSSKYPRGQNKPRLSPL